MRLFLGLIIALSSIIVIKISKPKNFTSETSSGITIKCERGFVKVPQIRGEKSTSKMKVKYVVLKSRSANPKAPIFFLAGGPGNGAISQLDHEYYRDKWNK